MPEQILVPTVAVYMAFRDARDTVFEAYMNSVSQNNDNDDDDLEDDLPDAIKERVLARSSGSLSVLCRPRASAVEAVALASFLRSQRPDQASPAVEAAPPTATTGVAKADGDGGDTKPAASVGGSGPDSDGGGRHSRPPPAALVVMADDGGGDGPGESKGGSGAGGSGDMGERASSPLPTAVAVPDDGVGVRSKADGGEHVRPHPPIAVVVAPERHEGERGGGGGGGEHGGEVPPQQPATNVAAVSEGERRRSDGGESGGHGPSHTAVPMPDSVVPAAAAGGSDGTVGRVDPEADEEECLVAVQSARRVEIQQF